MNKPRSPLILPNRQHDELALQNGIRQRYKQSWPKVILELLRRVGGLTGQTQSLVNLLLNNPSLIISTQSNNDGDIEITIIDEAGEEEVTVITREEMLNSKDHLEVLILQRLHPSKILAKQAKL